MISRYYGRILWALFGLFAGLLIGGIIEMRDLRSIHGEIWRLGNSIDWLKDKNRE